MSERNVEESAVDASMSENAVVETITTEKDEYELLCTMVNVIAKPLASRQLAKKLYKLVKKSSKKQRYLRNGLTAVQKAIREKGKGIVLLAGNLFDDRISIVFMFI
ncbi:hypothetical protein Q1695_000747 [Nippostrongylus brasiliensis]|nr:hypothetical protein Q1695_000747 [Nippostrongylus brasiliensis]